jgi:putative colanic acid biosynthesis UDP-glucose lipid carrier transferase
VGVLPVTDHVVKRSLVKTNAPLFEQLIRLADPLLIVVAGVVAYRIHLGDYTLPEHYVLAIIGVALVAAALFPAAGLYASQRGVTLFAELRRLVNLSLLLAGVWFAFLFLSKTGADFSRVWSIYWFVFTLAAHLTLRTSIRLALRELRRRGRNLRHVVIVGAGRLGTSIAARLRDAPWAGFAVHAYYDDKPELQGQVLAGVPVRGSIDRLLADLEATPVDQVWIALPLRAETRIREVLEGLRLHLVQVRFVPDIFNFTLLHHSVTEIVGLPVIDLTNSPLQGHSRVAKALEDFVLAALILALVSPLMLLIALGVKLSSQGPVLYRQARVTWNGERFTMLKFRSMPMDAEQATGPVWARAGERRTTRFGAFLRRTSLDELPQFINVLGGEMSIVGPRPERPELVERFKHEIPGYMQKHLVKAGITGWAQVNGLRGDTSLGERIQYDLYYIENWSVWFDLRIIALTLIHVVRGDNAY